MSYSKNRKFRYRSLISPTEVVHYDYCGLSRVSCKSNHIMATSVGVSSQLAANIGNHAVAHPVSLVCHPDRGSLSLKKCFHPFLSGLKTKEGSAESSQRWSDSFQNGNRPCGQQSNKNKGCD
jgi:hypothetical protein